MSSTTPKSAREAQKAMNDRLTEYQKRRDARVQEKLDAEAAERAKRELAMARRDAELEEQRKNRGKLPAAKSRSKSPVPKAQRAKKAAPPATTPVFSDEEREAAARLAAAEELAKRKQAEKANKKRQEQEQAARAAQQQQQLAERKAAQQALKKAEQARQKATDARLQKWNEQQQKRKQLGKDAVERVPKLSALLAMGGPEAEEYKKQQALAKLATWQSNAGDKWQFLEQTWDGVSLSEVTKEHVVTGISVDQAVEEFQNNPEKYLAMNYYPRKDPTTTEFTYILREGTVGYEAKDIRTDGNGKFVIWRHIYQRLKPFEDNVLPPKARDKYTDDMTFSGKKLHKGNKPLLPGRGMGLGDEANMELIGPLAQPAHIRQGACVGDCWLLSAIACLADFDWAVQRLFRKTTSPSIQERPQDTANLYTVTLWDLKSWKEVDVVVDERLPVRADAPKFLLGARPSKDGKFWVPILEKAIAVHCGGYDKLNGGNCTDAWPMLTGSRNQYVIVKNPKTGKYTCNAKYNSQEQKWSEHSNSPHDSNPSVWRVDWPTVGGGGNAELEVSEDELYRKVIAWDENNFLIGAGTDGASDKKSTDGIVDNHAYSVIDSRQNICAAGIDLLLIRNPWGEGGELQNGQFMRSGPGWDKYPDIKKELNPAVEDNGLCWVTKQEFFRYFPTIYVCALNTTRLKDPKYVNDLQDNFKRQAKAAPKRAKPAAAPVEEEFGPIIVNKSSDPTSPYKIVEQSFNGGVAFSKINKELVKGKSIAKAVDEFRANPEKILAIHYQNNMCDEGWPAEMHQFTYIYRDGTEGLEVDAVPKGGQRTMLTNILR